MFKKLLCLLLVLMLLPLSAVTAESAEEAPPDPFAVEGGDGLEMTDEEITQLLWEMYQHENAEGDYMVLPDNYTVPSTGKTGIFNLLLIGVDNYTEALTGRSDTMILASLNAYTGELKLVSFMRDTYVEIYRHGHNKLNASYSFGGAELLIRTLGESFGVHVDGYLAVNLGLMVEMIDAIGGVTATVSEDELKKLNGILEYYNWKIGTKPSSTGRLEQAGTQKLTGLQAMSYARIRKLDSDFVRVQRQQELMLDILDTLMDMDLVSLTRMMFLYISKVGTDITMSEGASLLTTLLNIENLQISTLRVPVSNSYSSRVINETYYVVPNLQKNQQAVDEFLYGTQEAK